MRKVINIEERLPHYTDEVICVKCGHRNMAVWPVGVYMKTLECAHCGETGYIIRTGCPEVSKGLEEKNG